METVAFFGTGMLGSGFVRAMLGRGIAVNVWNRTPEKTQALVALGARAYNGPESAVRGCRRVHLCLRDDASVDAVIDAALPGMGAGTHVVDHTTVLPRNVAARTERLAARGIAFMHAPVFMGPPQAADAAGVMMCSGLQSTYDALAPALAGMTGDLRYLGERADLASIYKLCGNAMILAVIGGLNDVFAISERSDIARERAYELFSFFSPAGQISGRGRRMAAGEYDPTWTIDMARKDALLMQETAGVALPVVDAVERALRAAAERGLAARDLAAIAQR